MGFLYNAGLAKQGAHNRYKARGAPKEVSVWGPEHDFMTYGDEIFKTCDKKGETRRDYYDALEFRIGELKSSGARTECPTIKIKRTSAS